MFMDDSLQKIGEFRKRYDKAVAHPWRFILYSMLYMIFPLFFWLLAYNGTISSRMGIFEWIASIIFIAVGFFILGIYFYLCFLVFYKRKYKLDIHENGFAYYLKDKTIIATWDEVSSISLIENGSRLKLKNGEEISFVGNEKDLEELDQIIAEKLGKVLILD